MKNGFFFSILLIFLFETTIQITPKIERHLNRPIKSRPLQVLRRLEPQIEDNDVAPSGDHHISKRSSGFDNFMKGFEKGSSFLSTIGKLNGSESIVTTVGGFVGGFFCIFFCNQGTSTNEASKSNKPPSFSSCKGPTIKEHIADVGTTTTTVSWNAPTASDPEDGSLAVNLVQGGAPGTQFDRGSHTIIYTASDKTMATTYCHFSFKVSVLTCDPIHWPAHGYVHCDKSEFMYGSKCTVGCFDGYEMVPQPTSVPYQIMCDKSKDNSATLNKEVPRCEAITCPVNATELDLENGTPICTHSNHKYDSSCFALCHSGYSISSGIIFSTCQQDKTWSTHLPDCKEIRCDPPLMSDKYLVYQCLDGFSYGSTCSLKCMGSFPLIGNDTITCERNDTFNPPLGFWSMENDQVQPYCLS